MSHCHWFFNSWGILELKCLGLFFKATFHKLIIWRKKSFDLFHSPPTGGDCDHLVFSQSQHSKQDLLTDNSLTGLALRCQSSCCLHVICRQWKKHILWVLPSSKTKPHVSSAYSLNSWPNWFHVSTLAHVYKNRGGSDSPVLPSQARPSTPL